MILFTKSVVCLAVCWLLQMKADVRHSRKQCMDKIKALKKAISEDDARRLGKEVDAVTERKVEKIVKLVREKEKSIMEG